jgi:hypothetical protein
MPPPEMRCCTKCKEMRPIARFSVTSSGYESWCKDCKNLLRKAHYYANLEREQERRRKYNEGHREQRAQYRAANLERIQAEGRTYYWAHTEESKAWRKENSAKIVARVKRWQDENPDRVQAHRNARYAKRRDEINAAARRRYAENPEPRCASLAKYRTEHPERLKATQRRHRQAHPGYDIPYTQRRRAKLRGVPVNDFTPKQWQEVKEYFNHVCAYCGAEGVTLTQDHLIPIARGGHHTMSNVVPACLSCNCRKHDKPLWTMLGNPYGGRWPR